MKSFRIKKKSTVSYQQRILILFGLLVSLYFLYVAFIYTASSLNNNFYLRNKNGSINSLSKSKSVHPYPVLFFNTNLTSNQKIAIVVRSHAAYSIQLLSLLWCLESQDFYGNLFVLVLPTEYESIDKLKEIIESEWYNGHRHAKRKITVALLTPSKSLYDNNCCLIESICTKEWRDKKLSENWPAHALDRYCSVNSPLHYALTDFAVTSLSYLCLSCLALLVTNADNLYAPSFLSKTFKLIEEEHVDVAMTNMLHMGQVVEVQPQIMKMDLGTVLISLRFMRVQNLTFLTVLPSPTEPQHYHDADFWLVGGLVDRGAKVHVVREVLFNHY